MPFSSTDFEVAAKSAIDFYVKNNPIDQVAIEHPWLRMLMSKAQEFPGAKQYIVEQLRNAYNSNFQWYVGANPVTYNSRDTLVQAQWPWRGWHDGFYLDEDRLAQNGIVVTDDRSAVNTRAERIQLTNLLTEQLEVLRLGCEAQFDLDLHGDGTASSSEALEGLHAFVDTTPTSPSTLGGISTSTNSWWQNNTNLSIAVSDLLAEMEESWRACTRNGGRPDFILAGSTFVDNYREAIRAQGEYTLAAGGIPRLDGGVGGATSGTDTGLYFKGVPIVWDPVAADLDSLAVYESTTYPWEKRCYFINTKHIKLRPLAGHNMISRTPPREYNRYVHYWALTWKGGMTMNRRNCHAVLTVA